jgi:hypothetical protein
LQERTILCDSRFDKAAMLNSCKINAAGRRSAAGMIHISAAIRTEMTCIATVLTSARNTEDTDS